MSTSLCVIQEGVQSQKVVVKLRMDRWKGLGILSVVSMGNVNVNENLFGKKCCCQLCCQETNSRFKQISLLRKEAQN